jgi:hypothetical protein
MYWWQRKKEYAAACAGTETWKNPQQPHRVSHSAAAGSTALRCRIAVRHGIHLVTRCCCSALHEHWAVGYINIKQMHLGQTLRAWKGWGRTNQTSLSDQLTEWQRHEMTEYQAPGTNTYSGLH